MPFNRLASGLLVLLLAFPFAACGDDATGPGDYDPQATADAVEEMVAATAELAPAFTGMARASAEFNGTVLGAALSDGALSLSPAAAAQLGPLTPTTFIPSQYFGMTLSWDPELGRYVAAADPAAPDAGVRIRYYAVSPVTGEPVEPLNPLGHIDLVDQSTDATNALRVVVTSEAGEAPVTLADYALDLSFEITPSSAVFTTTSSGYLSDGVSRLDFEVSDDLALSETSMTIAQDYSMELAGTGTSVSYATSFEGDPQAETGAGEIYAVITHDGSEVVFDLTASLDGLTGRVLHQGVVVALIHGAEDDLRFTDPDGNPLTAGEMEALASVWEAVDALLDLAESMLSFGA